jgi:hypothetical protein
VNDCAVAPWPRLSDRIEVVATAVWPNFQPTRTMQTVNMATFINPYGAVA